ncbi:MAG: hypothetical protein ACK44U_02135, partial [Sphingobacteriales bacterium]
KFIYAYAGYDNEDTIINGIGKTSKEAEAYFPLPLFYISFYYCIFLQLHRTDWTRRLLPMR